MDNGTACAGPIELTGDFGLLTLELSLRKEEDGWRVVAMEDTGL